MKHEQKSTELEEFLEQEIKKLEHESAHSRDDKEPSDIVWDAAEAAVALGKAKDLSEAANAVINSDAFAHLTDEVVLVARRAAGEPEAADGMVSDFQADSAMAIEFEEGDQGAGQGAGEEAEEGYLFSAVTPEQALHVEDEQGDIFGGGKPPDDDDKKDRGSRKPKTKKPKAKTDGDGEKADAAKAKRKRGSGKSGGKSPKKS